MPFALITIGLIMIVTGVKGTQGMMATQIRADAQGFITWVVAIGAIGALGYVDKLRAFSHYFMALVIIALLLSNKGFFAELQKALAAGPEKMPANPCGDGNASSGSGKGSITIKPQGGEPSSGSVDFNYAPDLSSLNTPPEVAQTAMKFLPYLI